MIESQRETGRQTLTDEEWRQRLTSEQYQVLREKGTEPPYSGRYAQHRMPGLYRCAGCDAPLFDSSTKYDSRTGWPSFHAPFTRDAVDEEEDTSHGMRRTEVLCSRCGGHLGHVFPDGPPPTGLRYCINSAALHFEGREGE
jgi:peptide-methionine (R)-S-oxide reductase